MSSTQQHLDAFDELRRHVAAASGLPAPEREEAILRAAKASFAAFDLDAGGGALVVGEVLKSCEGGPGIKSYDELNALYLFLEELLRVGGDALPLPRSDDCEPSPLGRELDTLRGIRDRLFVVGQEEPMVDGAQGIQMRRAEEDGSSRTSSSLFHGLVNRLIESLRYERVEDMLLCVFGDPGAMPCLRAAAAARREEGNPGTLTVITDPRTDPNEDDVTALIVLAALNKMFPVYRDMHLLVTGSEGSLDARCESLRFLEGLKGVRVTMQCASIAGHGESRFLAPYGGRDAESARDAIDLWNPEGSERASIQRGAHVVDLLPPETATLLVIGQVPTDWCRRLLELLGERPWLRCLSLQGPGFNTLKTRSAELKALLEALLARPEGEVHWSNNKAGLFLTADDVKQRFLLLSQYNPDILLAQGSIVASFLFTSGKGNFTSTFGDGSGWDYAKHMAPLLEKLRPHVIPRAA